MDIYFPNKESDRVLEENSVDNNIIDGTIKNIDFTYLFPGKTTCFFRIKYIKNKTEAKSTRIKKIKFFSESADKFFKKNGILKKEKKDRLNKLIRNETNRNILDDDFDSIILFEQKTYY